MSHLETAQHGVAALIGDLDDAQWAFATPCEQWDVAEVVRHLVVGDRAFTVALGGVEYELAVIDADVRRLAPADLPAAYAAASAAFCAAYREAPPDRPVPLPFGPRDPELAALVRTLEAVVHGWDLGRALGRVPSLGSESDLAPLVEEADRLRAALEEARPGNTALGTPSDVGPDAPVLDQLVARLGRRP